MEAAEWWVCAEAWVNVTLEMPSLGIGRHGHDVRVRFCGRWERRGLLAYDIERLRAALEETLRPLHKSRLSRALGGEAALEDLALHTCRALAARLDPPPLEARVEARVPEGWVELRCKSRPPEG